jgi:hypothetical protein
MSPGITILSIATLKLSVVNAECRNKIHYAEFVMFIFRVLSERPFGSKRDDDSASFCFPIFCSNKHLNPPNRQERAKSKIWVHFLLIFFGVICVKFGVNPVHL